MAFSIKLKIQFKNKRKIELEPYWWDKSFLIKKYKFKQILDGVYLDYLKRVTMPVLKSILKSQEKRLNDGLYSSPSWRSKCLPVHNKIYQLIKSKATISKVEILIYEWESGY